MENIRGIYWGENKTKIKQPQKKTHLRREGKNRDNLVSGQVGAERIKKATEAAIQEEERISLWFLTPEGIEGKLIRTKY